MHVVCVDGGTSNLRCDSRGTLKQVRNFIIAGHSRQIWYGLMDRSLAFNCLSDRYKHDHEPASAGY